jgi:hypothetical protein
MTHLIVRPRSPSFLAARPGGRSCGSRSAVSGGTGCGTAARAVSRRGAVRSRFPRGMRCRLRRGGGRNRRFREWWPLLAPAPGTVFPDASGGRRRREVSYQARVIHRQLGHTPVSTRRLPAGQVAGPPAEIAPARLTMSGVPIAGDRMAYRVGRSGRPSIEQHHTAVRALGGMSAQGRQAPSVPRTNRGSHGQRSGWNVHRGQRRTPGTHPATGPQPHHQITGGVPRPGQADSSRRHAGPPSP